MTNNQLWALYAKYFAKPCALTQILDRQGTNAEQDVKIQGIIDLCYRFETNTRHKQSLKSHQ